MGLAQSYIIDLFFTGMVYLGAVWFMVRWMNKQPKKLPPNPGQGDGGIEASHPDPVIDLPPGITTPSGDPYLSNLPVDLQITDKANTLS